MKTKKSKKITNGFRNLGVMLRPYWKNGKLYCVLYTLDSIIGNVWYTMMYVYLMQIVLDQLARGERFPVLAATVLAFGLLNVLWNIANAFLFKLYFDPKQDLILENIDREVQEHMHRTDYRYFDNPEFYDAYAVAYGSYAQKASDTFWTCSNVLAQVMTISALVAYVLSSTGYIVAIALLSVVARVLISKAVSRINVETDERLAPVNRFRDYLHQTMCSRENAMDSKCTGIFEILMGRHHDATREIVAIRRHYGMRQAALSSVEALVEDGFTGIMRLIVCSMVLAGKVGVGSFVSLLSAASSMAWKIQCIAGYYTKLYEHSLYGGKIRTFLEMPSTIEGNTGEGYIPEKKGEAFEIEVKNVSFHYPESCFGLSDLSMKFPRGKKIAIVGENGGGKTTLTKLLLRLYDPDEGAVLVDGKPLTEYNLGYYRGLTGSAFQEPPLYALSLRENLQAYRGCGDREISSALQRLSMDKMLEKGNASLDTPLTRTFDKGGIVLSGGERQKLSIARLMVGEFGLLIYDEPTAALDPIAEAKLNSIIFAEDNRATTVLISHRLTNVVNADYIYVMKDGRIAEEGTHASLMEQQGYYHEMFTLQAKNYIAASEEETGGYTAC